MSTMNDKLQNLIFHKIRDLVLEIGDILTKGAFGTGGRSKSFVAGAKARAESEPESLMKDLGIAGAVGGQDLEKVQKILNSAIHSNSTMSQAYMGARSTSDTPRGEESEVPVIAVVMGELDRKNGVRFLAHTLTAAKNAGFLTLEKSVQFASGEKNSIIIYSVEQ